MTETGMSLGTPHYMSPEQAMGERVVEPRWSPTGTELFYVSEGNDLVSVSVTLGDRFTYQAPRTLFSLRSYARDFNSRAYDVMPDGKAFVMLRGAPAESGAPILVENWIAELRRKLGR